MNKLFALSLDEEHYEGEYTSFEEATKAGVEAAKKYNQGDNYAADAFGIPSFECGDRISKFYVGFGERPQLSFERLANTVIEDAQEQAAEDDPDDYSDGWLDGEDVNSLAHVIEGWFAAKKFQVPYYIVESREEVEVKSDES